MKKIKTKDIYRVLLIGFIVLMSILTRLYFCPIKSGDFSEFLENWFNFLKENGGVFALKFNFGDYNLPYVQILALLTYLPIEPLYSIKSVSIIFDYLGAIFISMLVYEITKNKDYSIIGFLITIMLPTVILNSSAWAQCDFIYVTFIILSILFLVKDKYLWAFVALGISFAFKLQTIFVLPIFILYYISDRKFPIYYFFIIPVVDLILCFPAILVGKPIGEIFFVYINQTGEYSNYLSLNFPGIYNIIFSPNNNWVEMPNRIYKYIGIGITGLIYLILAIFIFIKKIKFSKEKIVEFTVWSVMICTYFLPQMHDRYMFSADVLSVVCAIMDKKNWYLPIVVNSASLYTYMSFLFGIRVVNIRIISLILGVVLIYYTFSILKDLIEKNKVVKTEN